MKKILLLVVLIIIACSNSSNKNKEKVFSKSTIENKEPVKEPTEQFKKYWYSGKAEISSYQLEQARYGEIRKGTAVLIYVTEDFLSKEQVKADSQKPDNIPVLKLNATKKFNTGIYPYSIMQSTFYPISDTMHAIKVSSSVQEWCGHAYTQLNNKKQYQINSHSYFQNEADQKFEVNKSILENELWTKIRINPDNLPIGKIDIIPSFEYCRLKHKEIKPYSAIISLQKDSRTSTYTITYPNLNRVLSITFNTTFPYEIESWAETFESGFGTNAKKLTTRAQKIKLIKSTYWNKNSNKHHVLRDSLGLKN